MTGFKRLVGLIPEEAEDYWNISKDYKRKRLAGECSTPVLKGSARLCKFKFFVRRSKPAYAFCLIGVLRSDELKDHPKLEALK